MSKRLRAVRATMNRQNWARNFRVASMFIVCVMIQGNPVLEISAARFAQELVLLAIQIPFLMHSQTMDISSRVRVKRHIAIFAFVIFLLLMLTFDVTSDRVEFQR